MKISEKVVVTARAKRYVQNEPEICYVAYIVKADIGETEARIKQRVYDAARGEGYILDDFWICGKAAADDEVDIELTEHD